MRLIRRFSRREAWTWRMSDLLTSSWMNGRLIPVPHPLYRARSAVRTWDLAGGYANGTVTTLRPESPRVGNLGGAQSTNKWSQVGTTNIVVSYNVSVTNSWDGVSISYATNSDYSDVTSVTFGIKGKPQSVKVEFEDAATHKMSAYFNSVGSTLKYYTTNIRDLEAAGLNSEQIRYINFVVDRGLAGTGNYTGTFTVVTAGLAP